MRNTRILTKEQLDYINENYLFEFKDNYIVTSVKTYDRKVLHDISKSFAINTRVRKVTISKEAIDYWLKYFKDSYTLVDVQNAISSLIVTYQDLSVDDIKKELNK